MQSNKLLKELSVLRKAVFTLNDLVKITQKKKEYLKVYVFRLKKRNILQEVEKGKYCVSQHPFITASQVIFPSYISFLSAYAYYQLTTQIPVKIQVVTLRSKKMISIDQYFIEFIKFHPQRMFGFHKEKFIEKEVFIAEKEKAIVDSLYLPKYCPLDETFLALEEIREQKLEMEKLISYALLMNSIVLLKRLGYLLELLGVDIYGQVQKKLNKRYDLLDPTLEKKTGKKTYSKKWRLLINRRF